MRSNKGVYHDNSVYNNDQFICLNELAQGTLCRLCLFKAILTGQCPKRVCKKVFWLEGLARVNFGFQAKRGATLGPSESGGFWNFLGQARFCERLCE